jgi:hypothetical protein
MRRSKASGTRRSANPAIKHQIIIKAKSSPEAGPDVTRKALKETPWLGAGLAAISLDAGGVADGDTPGLADGDGDALEDGEGLGVGNGVATTVGVVAGAGLGVGCGTGL